MNNNTRRRPDEWWWDESERMDIEFRQHSKTIGCVLVGAVFLGVAAVIFLIMWAVMRGQG
jgi:hypothetical protein